MTSDIPEGYDEDFPNRVSPVREAQNGSAGAESSSPFGSKQQLVTDDIEQAVKQTFTGTPLPQSFQSPNENEITTTFRVYPLSRDKAKHGMG